MSECKFWTWTKATGKCYLKTSKDGEQWTIEDYGSNHVGNSDKYVSGSKNCTHVSHQSFIFNIAADLWTNRHTYGQTNKQNQNLQVCFAVIKTKTIKIYQASLGLCSLKLYSRVTCINPKNFTGRDTTNRGCKQAK